MRALALCALLSLVGCGGRDEWVTSRAEGYYSARGFKIEGYQGHSLQPFMPACHWYTLSRGGRLWQSCLLRWDGDQIHEYNLTALEALQGGK